MKTNRIVVFGGSFNPLTKAHGYIIKKCKKAIKADFAIFLPANIDFMKSWKDFNEKDILSDEKRIKYINEFIKRNKNIVLETIEIDKITNKTYESLTYLKNKYKDKEIYFISGNEKYDEFDRWYKIDDLLNEFKLILINRNDLSLEESINKSDILRNHKENIIKLKINKRFKNYSSTLIRDALKKEDYKLIKKLTYSYIYKDLRRGNK